MFGLDLNIIHGVEVIVILAIVLFFVYIFYQIDLFGGE